MGAFEKFRSTLDIAVNLAILAAAACMIVLVVSYLREQRHSPNSLDPKIGTIVSAEEALGTDRNKKTLLIAISTECRFCKASMPLYREIDADRAHSDVQVVFGFGEPVAIAKQYLQSNGLPGTDVKQINFQDFRVQGTPTLLLFDGSGKILADWVGELSPERDHQVMDALHSR